VNRASARSRTHHTYTVGEEGIPGQGRSTTHGVSKRAASVLHLLASWCILGTQYIPMVRVDASPKTSIQYFPA
jgi:hypothetical protein